MQIVFALLDDIGAGHKACHTDIAAEIIIADGVYGDFHLRVALHQCVGTVRDKRRGQRAGDNIQTVRQHKTAVIFQLL